MTLTLGPVRVEVRKTWTDKRAWTGIGNDPKWGHNVSRHYYLPYGPKKPLREIFSGRFGGWCRDAIGITFARRISESTYRSRMGFK